MKLLNKVKKFLEKLLRLNKMARQKREWHEKFRKYMEFIVSHPNYKDLPELRNGNGAIKWIVSGNSELGKQRAKWWDDKVKKTGLPNRAEVARAIHPKELGGFKPCQICGKELSIFYVYPNKNTLRRINKFSGIQFNVYEKDIKEIFVGIQKKIGSKVFGIFKNIFDIPPKVKDNETEIIDYVIDNCKTKLSPGVMSNPPDRLEGFHTYNACCRSKEDTGRHSTNLARYSQDRRAYENWSEGDWNLSNRLMGEFGRFEEKIICPFCGKKRKMTADHIGPISLGFTHRPKFNPLCKSCNSGKNNRITLEDVKILIEDEKNGEKIVSWHSKYIWDSLKTKIENEEDALKLSKVMRLNLHNVLTLLSLIKEKGRIDFLKSLLKPEYSFYDYRFENFHPLRLNELTIVKKPLDSKNKQKNADRYIRISLESLDDYSGKENRRVKEFNNEKIKETIDKLLKLLHQGNNKESYNGLLEVIKMLSDEAIDKFF